ncbi:5945_t:CDS:2, partial [Gigaspora margarita]
HFEIYTKYGIDRIKEINNNIQQKQKIETIKYYLIQKNGNPKWFINRLNKLSKYCEQILKYSLLDPFWCYIVDFGKTNLIWNKIYERSLLDRLKTKCFHLDLHQIDDIISSIEQAYSDYNLSHEPPSIEIKSLNNKQKKWAESILIRWQINSFDNIFDSEHPTQCSYERKKLYHCPSFAEWPIDLKEAVNLFEKPEDEHFDASNSVLEKVGIIQNNRNEPIYMPNDKHNKHKLLSLDTTIEQGITLFRVYSRKVDTAITYSPETGIKLYLLICETKHLNKPQGGDYNKLCRMLNDAANSFILYWAKKCKKVTKELKKLFCELR